MSEHVTESTRYAIRLPNGELADDFVGDRHDAYLHALPDGNRPYVWDEAGDARKCFERIGTEVNFHGMRALFEEHAAVVRIDIRTVHTMDVQTVAEDAPIVEAEVAEVSVPRWFDRAEDVPVGVPVQAVGWPSSAPPFIRNSDGVWGRVDGLSMHLPPEQDRDAYLNGVWSPTGTGFVEILPEPAEPGPRTWATAEEIPFGAQFRGVDSISGAVLTRGRGGARTDNPSPMTEGYHYSTDTLNDLCPKGFVEVLS
jgi:hypothetical protein